MIFKRGPINTKIRKQKDYDVSTDVKSQINANYYGLDACKWQTVEEMGELAQALGKDHRLEQGQPVRDKTFNKDKSLEYLAEEIADVGICLEQLAYLLNVEAGVKRIRREKIDRTYESASAEMKWLEQKMNEYAKSHTKPIERKKP